MEDVRGTGGQAGGLQGGGETSGQVGGGDPVVDRHAGRDDFLLRLSDDSDEERAPGPARGDPV